MQVEAGTFREILELLHPVIPTKPTLSALKCAVIGDAKAYATDLDVAVEVDFPEAQDSCCVPVKDALKVLKGIPGNLTIGVSQSGQTLNLTWHGGKAELDTYHREDYPPLPQVDGVRVELDERLVDAATGVVGYCATDDSRPELTGVMLSFGDELEVAAADGFRMAYTTVAAPSQLERRIIIPARGVKLLGKLWRKSPGSPGVTSLNIAELVAARRRLELTVGEDKVKFCFGAVNLIVKLIEKTPPKFKDLIPQQPSKTVQVFAPDLLRAVKQLQAVQDAIHAICLAWEGETLRVWAKGEKQQAELTVPVTTTGEPGRVALSGRYLGEFLKDKQGVVSMQATNEHNPVLFRSASPIVVVIMPMFVNW